MRATGETSGLDDAVGSAILISVSTLSKTGRSRAAFARPAPANFDISVGPSLVKDECREESRLELSGVKQLAEARRPWQSRRSLFPDFNFLNSGRSREFWTTCASFWSSSGIGSKICSVKPCVYEYGTNLWRLPY